MKKVRQIPCVEELKIIYGPDMVAHAYNCREAKIGRRLVQDQPELKVNETLISTKKSWA
jgi:hypothetical protein